MQLYWQSRLWYQVTKNLPPDTILKASTTAWSWQDVSDLPSTDSKGIQKIQTSAGPEVSLEEKRGKLEDGAWPLTYHAMISFPLHLQHSPCHDLQPSPSPALSMPWSPSLSLSIPDCSLCSPMAHFLALSILLTLWQVSFYMYSSGVVSSWVEQKIN